MARIGSAVELVPHACEAVKIHGQILEYCCPMSQDIIACEHCVLLFQYESHVICGVARTVECSQRSSFCLKDLAVMYRVLSFGWIMFIDCGPRTKG